MARVFVTYSHQDQEFVEQLVLTSRVRVWLWFSTNS